MKRPTPGETARVRRICVERSNGLCECGCGRAVTRVTGELDHFFSRGKAPTTERTCWFIAVPCHHWKTDNFPSKAYWLASFALHCKRHGFDAELDKVRAQQEWVETRETLTKLMRRAAR